MIQPDFRKFKGRGVQELMHSAKGSVWKEHKYIKKENGQYVYPSHREGGKTTYPSLRGTRTKMSKTTAVSLNNVGKVFGRAVRENSVVMDTANQTVVMSKIIELRKQEQEQKKIVEEAKNKLDLAKKRKDTIGIVKAQTEYDTANKNYGEASKRLKDLEKKSNLGPAASLYKSSR